MRARPRILEAAVVLWCALMGTWCGGGTPSSPTPAAPPITVIPEPPVIETPVNESPQLIPPTPPSGTTWINIVGDTGWCGSPAMAQLARLLEQLGGDILFAGDLAYDSGTLEEFRR